MIMYQVWIYLVQFSNYEIWNNSAYKQYLLLEWSVLQMQLFQSIWCWNLNIPGELANIMAADALAPCGSRSSTAMVLFMQDKQILVFHKEVCQQCSPQQSGEMIQMHLYVT